MDTRIARLEKDVEGLMEMVGGLVKDVAEIKGKISMLPTTVQLFGAVLASTGLAAALVFGAIKVAMP